VLVRIFQGCGHGVGKVSGKKGCLTGVGFLRLHPDVAFHAFFQAPLADIGFKTVPFAAVFQEVEKSRTAARQMEDPNTPQGFHDYIRGLFISHGMGSIFDQALAELMETPGLKFH
jgi:hypothetical protein